MGELRSVNPATGELIAEHRDWSAAQLESALQRAERAASAWAATPIEERAVALARAAAVFEERRSALALRMTLEMGKRLTESRAEIDKCVWALRWFSENGPALLADEVVATDATRSFVRDEPLGIVLAIMPWNFPFWQVVRAAAPALVAGNTLLLKHAPTVQGCAQDIEAAFTEAGLPEGAFVNLPIALSLVPSVIADRRVAGVTLTGSARAGRAVAEAAGRALKKTVLELGVSDPFVVLDDADLDRAADAAVASRFQNAGQSCIAAKRFVLMAPIADAFLERFHARVAALRTGDPSDEATTLAPLARADLRDTLDAQVRASVAGGARIALGGAPLAGPGYFYAPTILTGVEPGVPAADEEVFGPVAAVIEVTDEPAAIAAARATRYGLGLSVWSQDVDRALRVAARIPSGAAFVNGLVKSDPRLPFGGVAESGYGRELSRAGLREFVNVRSYWVG